MNFFNSTKKSGDQIVNDCIRAISDDQKAMDFLSQQLGGRNVADVDKNELVQVVNNTIRFAIQNRGETIL